jgi:hypothetical protein
MRKPSKVVCINERRRKLDTELQRPIPTRAEAIGTLHWERRSNRIDFFLTPLFGTRGAEAASNPREAKVTVLPLLSNDSGE